MNTLLNRGNNIKRDRPFPHPPWKAKSFRTLKAKEVEKESRHWFAVVNEPSWKAVLWLLSLEEES